MIEAIFLSKLHNLVIVVTALSIVLFLNIIIIIIIIFAIVMIVATPLPSLWHHSLHNNFVIICEGKWAMGLPFPPQGEGAPRTERHGNQG